MCACGCVCERKREGEEVKRRGEEMVERENCRIEQD